MIKKNESRSREGPVPIIMRGARDVKFMRGCAAMRGEHMEACSVAREGEEKGTFMASRKAKIASRKEIAPEIATASKRVGKATEESPRSGVNGYITTETKKRGQSGQQQEKRTLTNR